MMHLLPPEFRNKSRTFSSIARYSNLEYGEVISAIWVYLQDHAQDHQTIDANAIIKKVSSELRRKNHYDVKIARDKTNAADDGAEHLSLFDLSQKDKINHETPLDILLKLEQRQRVDEFIKNNFGGSEDAARAHFGDTKELSERLKITRRRAQQIIKKRNETAGQLDLFDIIGGDK